MKFLTVNVTRGSVVESRVAPFSWRARVRLVQLAEVEWVEISSSHNLRAGKIENEQDLRIEERQEQKENLSRDMNHLFVWCWFCLVEAASRGLIT
jgi:hypothetical protein